MSLLLLIHTTLGQKQQHVQPGWFSERMHLLLARTLGFNRGMLKIDTNTGIVTILDAEPTERYCDGTKGVLGLDEDYMPKCARRILKLQY